MPEKITRCRLMFAASALAAAVALAGCGDGDSDDGDDAGAGGPETATEPPASPNDTGDDDGRDDDWDNGSDEIGLHQTEFGAVIVDDDDRTLYLFTEDSDGTPTCYDECAADWPPLLADDDDDRDDIDADDGLDDALLGTVERENGAAQLTYNGHPLYYWTGDAAPGDAEGQGLDEAWYVLDAQGNAVTDTP